MIDVNTLTDKDLNFLSALKAKGVSQQEAFARLSKIKTAIGKKGDISQANAPKGPSFMRNLPAKIQDGLETTYDAMLGKNSLVSKVPVVKQAGELVGGALKGGINLAAGLGDLATNIPDVVIPGDAIPNTPFTDLVPENLKKGEGFFEKAGRTAFDVGTAGVGALRGGQAAGLATQGLSKLAPAGQVLKTGIKEGAEFLGRSAGGTAAFTEATDQRLPTPLELGLGAAGDKLISLGLKYLPNAGSRITTTVSDFIDNLKRGGLSKSSYRVKQAVLSDEALASKAATFSKAQDAHMQDELRNPSAFALVGDAIYKGYEKTNALRKQIGKQIGDYFAKNSVDVDLNAVKNKIEGADGVFSEFGVKAGDKGLDFKGSSMQLNKGAQSKINEIYSLLNGVKKEKNKALALRRLAESIDDLIPDPKSNVASQIGTKESAFLVKLASTINTTLNDAAAKVDDTFATLRDEYSDLSKIRTFLNTRLGSEGVGGFQIAKQLFSEGKYGQEVQEAIELLSKITGKDYLTDASIAKLVSELSNDKKAESLLNLTSKSGLLDIAGGAVADTISGNAKFYQDLLNAPELDNVPAGTLRKVAEVILRISQRGAATEAFGPQSEN